MKLVTLFSAAILMVAATAICGPAFAAGDANRGETLYQGCQDCHSIEENDLGPKHKGVFGRNAGAVPDYRYSAAVKQSGIVWNEENLDKWLTNPQGLIPGAKMFYHLADPKDRADVIQFLKERAN